MGESVNDDARTADRLDSWKEIAAYLNRDVSTVQRWEKREGMPVHRHLHDKLGSVYATRTELDAWSRGRNPRVVADVAGLEAALDGTGGAAEAPPRPRRHRLLQAVGAIVAVATVATAMWILRSGSRVAENPLAAAKFEQVTKFEGTQGAAAISRDGKFVAFLSDHEGRTDAWVTQVGTGRFYNLTHGALQELTNPSVRTITFSPDGAFVYVWARTPDGSPTGRIDTWAVPTLGGSPRRILDNVAEAMWSDDFARLVYHTPGPGDPMFVTEQREPPPGRQIFAAVAGRHAHFPVWSRDRSFIYFVQGSVPEPMDIWRIRPGGGDPERITFHDSRVSHPAFLDDRTLVYLATDADGGPGISSVDLDERKPRRLSSGVDRYTSLAASADGRRLVVTAANPKSTFWRLPLSDATEDSNHASRIALTTGPGSSPRLGPAYLLYVFATDAGESIWKLADDGGAELWSGPGAHILGAPAIAARTHHVAFSASQRARTGLFVMSDDGTDARLVTESLNLAGAPAWAPDERSLIVAANDDGVPRIFSVSLDGHVRRLMTDYAAEPSWSPDGRYFVYSGADIGTTFSVKAASADGRSVQIPALKLTRGARRLGFLPGGHALIVLKGEIEHKDLWLVDLDTGAERRLTNFGRDFIVRDFDVSPDGREVVVERVEAHSDIVLLDLRR